MTDYIKREDAINAINGITMYRGTIPYDSTLFNIDKIQSADVRENVKAKIIDNGGAYQCSNCKAILSSEIDYIIEDHKPISYCPNCGARMEE